VIAPDLVAAAGADALALAAQDRLEAHEPVAALHLTDVVLAVEPHHQGARRTAVAATRQLLDGSDNFWERAWLSRCLHRLEAP
jgi:Alkyl sulfatase dimerisation